MKKLFEQPEMKITAFESEEVMNTGAWDDEDEVS